MRYFYLLLLVFAVGCGEEEKEDSEPSDETTTDDGDDDGDDDGEAETTLSVGLGNNIVMDFVLIDVSAGDPLGRYTLTNNFYMMTTEVTQGQFTALQSYYDVTVDSLDHGVGDNYPAYYASWYEFASLANALSAHEGLTECYTCSGSGRDVTCAEHISYSGSDVYNCPGYRLPTEAEFELAARSGTTSEFWTGDGSALGGDVNVVDEVSCDSSITIEDGVLNPMLSDYAWFCGNWSGSNDSTYGTKEVGQKLSNGFGLYDMHGNVWEWIADWWGCSYPSSSTNPMCGSTGSNRVKRGGYWISIPSSMRAAYRHFNTPSYRISGIGARLARSAP